MKAKYLSLLLFLMVFNSFSQNAETLKTAMQKLYEANYLMDFEGILSFAYPKMVDTLGKDIMLEKTEHFYENEEYRLRYQLQTVPFQFGTIKTIEGKSFCVITIRIPKRYFFENKLTAEQAALKKTWLQEINNTKEVTFEPNRNSFNVKMTTTFIAVFDDTTNGDWKFFNFDSLEQRASFNSLFDENVKTALGLNK